MIGAALGERLRADGVNLRCTTRREDRAGADDLHLDLEADPAGWPELPEAPVWVICAAVARIADCRNDPAHSHAVNVRAVEALAGHAHSKGAHMVFLSTDKVFDGAQPHTPATTPTCPGSVYGRQKAQAEAAIAAYAGLSYVIVRLTKVLSRTDKLLTGWIENLSQGKPVTPFSDMTMAPVSLENVVDALVWAIRTIPGGIVQISGPRDITYEQAARHLATRIHADMGLVQSGFAASAGLSADETPPFTSLDTTRLYAESSIRIADAYDLIDDILAARTQHA